MPSFEKLMTVSAMAVALAASPVAAQAQAEPAGPEAAIVAPHAGHSTAASNQPGTTNIPASTPVAQPQGESAVSNTAQVAAFVEQQFGEADANGDGVITREEFRPWMARVKAAESADAVEAAEVGDPRPTQPTLPQPME